MIRHYFPFTALEKQKTTVRMSTDGWIWFLSSISLSLVATTKAQKKNRSHDEFMTEPLGSPGKTLTRNESEYSLGLNREPFVIPLGQPCFYAWPTIVVGMIKEESVKIVLLSALLVFFLRKK